VSPSNAKVGVTQADLDTTLKQMTGELYHTKSLSGYRFTSAATKNLQTGDPAVDSIRRSSELGMMGKTEALIVPPPPPPAQSQAAPTGGNGGPKHP
jgi:hypothetical protein